MTFQFVMNPATLEEKKKEKEKKTRQSRRKLNNSPGHTAKWSLHDEGGHSVLCFSRWTGHGRLQKQQNGTKGCKRPWFLFQDYVVIDFGFKTSITFPQKSLVQIWLKNKALLIIRRRGQIQVTRFCRILQSPTTTVNQSLKIKDTSKECLPVQKQWRPQPSHHCWSRSCCHSGCSAFHLLTELRVSWWTAENKSSDAFQKTLHKKPACKGNGQF